MTYENWYEQEGITDKELAAMAHRSPVIDLDPRRTTTHLENGVPYCYLGHPDCYDTHETERRADEADWESGR